MDKALAGALPGDTLESMVQALANRQRDPYTVVDAIVNAAQFERWKESS